MLLRGVHMACLSLTNMAMQSTVVTQGLGVEIDEAAVRRAAAAGHSWRDREWRLPDGTAQHSTAMICGLPPPVPER
jgi:hypothetical protein